MISLNNDRIIGDIIELNAEIVSKRINSKFPSLISNYIANRDRRKLLKIIDKFGKSDYILNKNNLFEFFIYIYNNFEGSSYGCIKKVAYMVNKNISTIYADITIENVDFNITLSSDSNDIFIHCCIKYYTGLRESFSVQLDKLITNKDKLDEVIYKLNKQLLLNLSKYSESCISKYNGKEKGYGKIKSSL